jgi:hypothetical protein
VTILPLSTTLRDLRVRIETAPAGHNHDTADAADAEWARLCAQNPRLFNGPVLAFAGLAPDGTIRAHRDDYRRLAVQPAVRTGVVQLSVTGLLLAPDHEGTPHVAFGRRSVSTRLYGGLWELAPSGGLDAPPMGTDALDGGDILRHLLAELREEMGLAIDERSLARTPAPVCVALDPRASSADLVLRIELTRPVEELIALADAAPDRWEYERVRWVSVAELPAFVAAEGPESFIPPAVPTLRAAGLLGVA